MTPITALLANLGTVSSLTGLAAANELVNHPEPNVLGLECQDLPEVSSAINSLHSGFDAR